MKKLSTLLVAAAAGMTILAATGCSTAPNDGDAGTTDAGSMDAGPDCFTNPTTYNEIINACTTATAIDKTVSLPLLSDGGLPPLPN